MIDFPINSKLIYDNSIVFIDYFENNEQHTQIFITEDSPKSIKICNKEILKFYENIPNSIISLLAISKDNICTLFSVNEIEENFFK